MNYFKHELDMRRAVNWNSSLTCSDYGFLMLLLEYLSSLEGNRLAINKEKIKEFSDFCEMSVDMTTKSLNVLINNKIVQSDGIGVWSKYLDSALELSTKRSQSASFAAKARWDKIRAKNRVVNDDNEPIVDDLDLIDIEPIDIDIPKSVSVVVDIPLLDIGSDETTITKKEVIRRDSEFVKFSQFFEDMYNEVRKKVLPKSRTVTINTNDLAVKRLRGFHKKKVTMDDLEIVIKNIFKDSYHAESNFKFVTMDFILRDEIFNRFVAFEPKESVGNNKKGPTPEITVRNM